MLHYNDLYWFFKKALSDKDCKRIIKEGNKKRIKLARIGSFSDNNFKKLNNKQKNVLKNTRDSHVSFLDEQWLYNLIFKYVHKANELAKWNFVINWAEPVQFTKYKKNQHYDWHCDFNGKTSIGKIRKLSVVVSLSDPEDYEGGDFEFQFRNKHNPLLITPVSSLKPKGSIIVFPSYLWHRVKPITKGTRYSLVMWASGEPYK